MERKVLSAYLPEFLDWEVAEQGASRRTVSRYRSILRRALEWVGEQPPTLPVLQAYRSARMEEGIRPRTIRVEFTAIYSFLAWGKELGLVTEYPERKAVKLPRLDAARRLTPTEAETLSMFRAVLARPQHTLRARYLRGRQLGMLTVLAWAGLRFSEAAALDVADVWREEETWSVYVRVAKGAESRHIPLGSAAKGYLAEWLAVRSEWVKAHGHKSDALWPVDSSRRMGERGIRTMWEEVREQAGVTRKVTPHGMRHQYATEVARVGGLATAQALLGHSRIETTARYLRTDASQLQRAVDVFSAPTGVLSTETGTGSRSQGRPTRQATRVAAAPARRVRVPAGQTG